MVTMINVLSTGDAVAIKKSRGHGRAATTIKEYVYASDFYWCYYSQLGDFTSVRTLETYGEMKNYL